MECKRNARRYIVLFFVLLFAVLFMNQASAITAVVNVPERYSEISAGERVYWWGIKYTFFDY